MIRKKKNSKAGDFNSGSEMDNTVKLRVAMDASIKLRSVQEVSVVKKGKGLIYFEPGKQLNR